MVSTRTVPLSSFSAPPYRMFAEIDRSMTRSIIMSVFSEFTQTSTPCTLRISPVLIPITKLGFDFIVNLNVSEPSTLGRCRSVLMRSFRWWAAMISFGSSTAACRNRSNRSSTDIVTTRMSSPSSRLPAPCPILSASSTTA